MTAREDALREVAQKAKELGEAWEMEQFDSRRAVLAAAALQGLPLGWGHDEAAQFALNRADALLKALSE